MSHCASLLEPIEKLWKEGSGTGYVQPFEIQSLSSFVFSEVKWGEQWKMRVSQERHPPDHCTKRPTMIISVWQHIICAYCAVVLLTLHLSQNTYHLDSASALWSLEKVQMEYISSKVELFLGFAICPHKCNSLFCVYILPNPLWRVWDPLPHHVSFP